MGVRDDLGIQDRRWRELYRRNVTSARLRKLPRTVPTKAFGSCDAVVAGLGARVRGSGGSSVLVLLVAAFHASHTLERLSSCTKLSVDSVVRSVGAEVGVSLRRASVSASLESSELTRRRLGTPMDEVMRDA